MTHSVGWNGITGDAADQLANMVLEHASMTDFCGIPLVSLRDNSITELNLEYKGVGVPGAIVLSKLLPSTKTMFCNSDHIAQVRLPRKCVCFPVSAR